MVSHYSNESYICCKKNFLFLSALYYGLRDNQYTCISVCPLLLMTNSSKQREMKITPPQFFFLPDRLTVILTMLLYIVHGYCQSLLLTQILIEYVFPSTTQGKARMTSLGKNVSCPSYDLYILWLRKGRRCILFAKVINLKLSKVEVRLGR